MSDRGGDLTRDVLLRIRAQNLSTADFKTVTTSVNTLTAALDKQVEAAARGEVKERELAATLIKLGQAADGLKGIAVAIDRYKDFDKVLTGAQRSVDAARAKLESYQTEAEKAGTSTDRVAATVEKLTAQVQKQEANLERARQSYIAMGEALRVAGVDTNNLAEAENRLRQVADQSGIAVTKLSDAKLNYLENIRKTTEAVNAQAAAEAKAAQAAVQAGRAEADRTRTAAEVAQKAAAFNEQTRQQRYEAVRKEVEANAQARSEEVAAERRAAAEITQQRAAQNQTLRQAEEAAQERFRRFSAERIALNRKERQEPLALTNPLPIPRPLPGGTRTDATGRVGRGEGAAVSLFGLKPYELTNLSYQINDVVTGFASGQKASQILAQQGGQFIQIFGLKALQYFPQVAAAAAAVTVVIGSLNHALRDVGSNREFAAAIAANTNAAGYQKEALTALRKEVLDMGVSWGDAGKLIKTAIEGNIKTDRIKEFAQAARDVADVTGKNVVEAMRDLVKGFDGSEESIGRLNDEYHFLSATELQHVRDLLAQQKQQEALAFALDKLTEQYRKAAREGLDPWTEATRAISKAWNDLLTTIGNTTAFKNLADFIEADIKALTGLVEVVDRAIKGVGSWTAVARYARDWALGDAPVATAPIPPLATTGGAATNATAIRQWLDSHGYSPNAAAAVMGNAATESGFNPAAMNPSGHFGLLQWDKTRQAPLNGSTDIATQLELMDQELQKLDPAFKSATDSVKDLTLRFERSFERSGGQLNDSRVAAAEKEAGRGAVTSGPTDEQVRRGQELARADQERRDSARAISEEAELQTERAKAILETQGLANQDEIVAGRVADLRYRQTLDRLQRESKDRRQATEDARHLADIQAAGDKAVAGAQGRGITGYKDLQTIRDQGEAEERTRLQRLDAESDRLVQLQKQIAQLGKGLDSKNATDLERALRAVDEQFVSIYESQKKAAAQATPATKAQVDATKQQIDALKERYEAEARIDSFQKQARSSEQTRSQLIQTYNALEESGAISIGEKEQKIKEAFELTKPAILEAAAALQKLVDTDKSLTPEKAALLTAEVKRLRAEVEYTDPFLKGLRTTITDSISNHASQAFDTVAEAIGGVIAKTKTWKDVWTSLKTAAADFFAGILKDIATYIIKAQLAKLVSSFLPGSGLGSLFGSTTETAAATTASGSSGGIFSFLSGANPAAVFHGGGTVGAGNVPTRGVPSSWFSRAPRYHDGIPSVGLAANEQAAILKKGEEVLAADNPRNIMNIARRGVQSGGGDVHIRTVLVDDRSRVPEAMAGAQGERVVIQHLVRNAATVRQIVGR